MERRGASPEEIDEKQQAQAKVFERQREVFAEQQRERLRLQEQLLAQQQPQHERDR